MTADRIKVRRLIDKLADMTAERDELQIKNDRLERRLKGTASESDRHWASLVHIRNWLKSSSRDMWNEYQSVRFNM